MNGYGQTDAQAARALLKHCFNAADVALGTLSKTVRQDRNGLHANIVLAFEAHEASSEVQAASCVQHAEDSQSRHGSELHPLSCPLQAAGHRGSVAFASQRLQEPFVQPYSSDAIAAHPVAWSHISPTTDRHLPSGAHSRLAHHELAAHVSPPLRAPSG